MSSRARKVALHSLRTLLSRDKCSINVLCWRNGGSQLMALSWAYLKYLLKYLGRYLGSHGGGGGA